MDTYTNICYISQVGGLKYITHRVFHTTQTLVTLKVHRHAWAELFALIIDDLVVRGAYVGYAFSFHDVRDFPLRALCVFDDTAPAVQSISKATESSIGISIIISKSNELTVLFFLVVLIIGLSKASNLIRNQFKKD